jgi:hypothetical protein
VFHLSRTIAAIALGLGCAHEVAAAQDVPARRNDAMQIYAGFLEGWMGKEKRPISVAIRAEAPSADDLKQFSECASQDKTAPLHWLPAKPTDNLSDSVGTLPYVRLVDPVKWKARDPSESIAQGKSVESAVESGFAHGLLTFSTMVFDESHQMAAFTYSYVCGSLCGSGGAVIFKRSSGGWVQRKQECGGWIS